MSEQQNKDWDALSIGEKQDILREQGISPDDILAILREDYPDWRRSPDGVPSILREHFKDSNPQDVDVIPWIYAHSPYPQTYTARSGKWMLFLRPSRVGEVWTVIKSAVEQGILGPSAKCSTSSDEQRTADKVICIYVSWDSRPVAGILRPPSAC